MNCSRSRISFKMPRAISCSRSVRSSWSKNPIAALIANTETSAMLRPETVTASDSGFNRLPLHAGQGLSDMYRSSSAFRYSDCVSS